MKTNKTTQRRNRCAIPNSSSFFNSKNEFYEQLIHYRYEHVFQTCEQLAGDKKLRNLLKELPKTRQKIELSTGILHALSYCSKIQNLVMDYEISVTKSIHELPISDEEIKIIREINSRF